MNEEELPEKLKNVQNAYFNVETIDGCCHVVLDIHFGNISKIGNGAVKLKRF